MRVLQLNLALRVAALYALFGSLWVLFSDRLLLTLTTDPQRLVEIGMVKGWVFVAASAALIYLLLRYELKQRFQTEKTLRESEERYRLLFDRSLDAILLTAPDGWIFSANPAACRIFGRTEEEIVQVGRNGLVDVSDPRLPAALEERARTGKFKGELTFTRQDGVKFPGEISTAIFTDQAGQLRASMIIHDITARKQAETVLKQAETYLRTVLSSAPITIFAIDNQGLFTLFEGKGLDRAGLKPGENVGVSALDLYAAISFVEYDGRVTTGRDVFQRAFAGETVNAIDELHGVYFDNHIGPLRDTEGKVIGIVGVATDITKRKRAEQQLAESAAQLRALSQRLVKTQETERRSIARELHDEVGQVILAVKTNLETMQLVREPETLNERLVASINIVSRALEQVRALALNLRPSLLDDFGLMPTLEWYLERQAKDVPFKINFQADLPDMRFPPDIETNCFRVAQAALTNITRHAQATQVEIMLHLIPDTQELELSVRDDGVGFDVPAALERARRGESLGLLSIQERVQLIGGQIAIESAPGHGTEIRVRVPIKAEG